MQRTNRLQNQSSPNIRQTILVQKRLSRSSQLTQKRSTYLLTQIYLEATKWGPEHPYVAQNYFLLGKVFVDMGNQAVGETFFSKVAEIWYRYLKNFFDKVPEEQ